MGALVVSPLLAGALTHCWRGRARDAARDRASAAVPVVASWAVLAGIGAAYLAVLALIVPHTSAEPGRRAARTRRRPRPDPARHAASSTTT